MSGLASLKAYGQELLKASRPSGSSLSHWESSRDHYKIPSPVAHKDFQLGDQLEDGCITAVELVTRSAPKGWSLLMNVLGEIDE